MKPLTVKSFLPAIAWFIVILILISTPGDELPQPAGWWRWINLIHFDKLVHMGIFAIQVFLLILPVARRPFTRKQKAWFFLLMAIFGSVWGMGTELIQKFLIPSRSFDMVDWTADTIGSVAGYFFCKRFLLDRFAHSTQS